MVEVTNNPLSGFSAETAYNSIREKILSGELEGGSWLRESDLATALGISRTPIREALRHLVAEGLVEHYRNRGVRVPKWTAEDLAETFEVRLLLEPAACALAASNDLINLHDLELIADQMESAIGADPLDLAAVTTLNNLFHQTIMQSSGNRQLYSLVQLTVQFPLVRRTFSTFSMKELKRSVAHHREVIEAIRAKDPLWAEAIMRAHIAAGRDNALRTTGPASIDDLVGLADRRTEVRFDYERPTPSDDLASITAR